MGFLSFKKKKSQEPPPPTPPVVSQSVPSVAVRVQHSREYPPLEQICHISDVEPMVDILSLLHQFQEGLSHLDGRLPSKKLQEEAEKLRKFTDTCIDSGDFDLLDQIFTALEKYNQLTAFPTSGSPADDLRVDLATLRGLVNMSGARSEILELIRDCEDQCSKVLNSPAGESSGLILSEELEDIRKIYNQKSSSMHFEEPTLSVQPQPASQPPVSAEPVAPPAELPPQTFRLDSEENSSPVRDETFSDVNRVLIETQLSLATMTRDIPSLALVIPRAEELGLPLAPAGRKILAEEVLEEALLAFNPLSSDTLLRRLSQAAERAGADSSEATAALAAQGPWKFVLDRFRFRASAIFNGWRELTSLGVISRKRQVFDKLRRNFQHSKVAEERAVDFALMAVWRKATRIFSFWAKFCILKIYARKMLKSRTLRMFMCAAEDRIQRRARNWGDLINNRQSFKMRESVNNFARLEFSFKIWRRQSLKQKQRIQNFWRREPEKVEHIKTVTSETTKGNLTFSIHVSKQGTDLVYTTVHETKLPPLRFPDPPVFAPPPPPPPPPVVEDRWDLEAKRWSIFRSM